MTAMTKPVRDAADRAPRGRRAREFKMIAAMLRMYCRTHHNLKDTLRSASNVPSFARLCAPALGALRVRRGQPTCAKCTVHCYKASMRERVRVVMRWAGPRMLWHHPLLAIRRMIDGRLPAPALQRSP